MFIIIMGVSGSGKTTIGTALAKQINWPFYDGDDFHPLENKVKMSAGVPLSDDDRAGWLDALSALIHERIALGENGVVACSALKEVYRDRLRENNQNQVRFVYLKGSFDVIVERMKNRTDHYMKPEMLLSQFSILEEPEDSLTLDVSIPPKAIVEIIVEQLVDSMPGGWREPWPRVQ